MECMPVRPAVPQRRAVRRATEGAAPAQGLRIFRGAILHCASVACLAARARSCAADAWLPHHHNAGAGERRQRRRRGRRERHRAVAVMRSAYVGVLVHLRRCDPMLRVLSLNSVCCAVACERAFVCGVDAPCSWRWCGTSPYSTQTRPPSTPSPPREQAAGGRAAWIVSAEL